MTLHQCCERALGDRFGGYPCQRPATVNRDGEWYCWQHDPERVAEEEKKRHAQWEAKRAIDDRKWRRRDAERRACTGVPTEVLERISMSKLLAACEKAAGYLETVEQFGVRERELMEQLEAARAD